MSYDNPLGTLFGDSPDNTADPEFAALVDGIAGDNRVPGETFLQPFSSCLQSPVPKSPLLSPALGVVKTRASRAANGLGLNRFSRNTRGSFSVPPPNLLNESGSVPDLSLPTSRFNLFGQPFNATTSATATATATATALAAPAPAPTMNAYGFPKSEPQLQDPSAQPMTGVVSGAFGAAGPSSAGAPSRPRQVQEDSMRSTGLDNEQLQDSEDPTRKPLELDTDNRKFCVPREWEARFRRANTREARLKLLCELQKMGNDFVEGLKKHRRDKYYERMRAMGDELNAGKKRTVRGRIHSKLTPFVKNKQDEVTQVIMVWLVDEIGTRGI